MSDSFILMEKLNNLGRSSLPEGSLLLGKRTYCRKKRLVRKKLGYVAPTGNELQNQPIGKSKRRDIPRDAPESRQKGSSANVKKIKRNECQAGSDVGTGSMQARVNNSSECLGSVKNTGSGKIKKVAPKVQSRSFGFNYMFALVLIYQRLLT